MSFNSKMDSGCSKFFGALYLANSYVGDAIMFCEVSTRTYFNKNVDKHKIKYDRIESTIRMKKKISSKISPKNARIKTHQVMSPV